MDGIARIDRVVLLLDVWLDADLFPFAKMKVKVLERQSADFLAVTNVSRKHPKTGSPEWLSGLGGTIEEAVNDLLTRFVADVRQQSNGASLTLEDFEWSAPEDF